MSLDRIEQAFQAVARKDFLPELARPFAGEDLPISIGYGQTNSQPSTVYKMLSWLDTKPGQTVLDVGSGSGWTTALLAHIVGPSGYVFAVDIVPELVAFGKDNCAKLDIQNVTFKEAGGSIGLPDYAPYDRILVSAQADILPEELIGQLKEGGKLVIPVAQSILVVTKGKNDSLMIESHSGFVFVPLIAPPNHK